ncbi:hypothetical protein [Candidatus Amarobacter glycogenicus]|uniref:hypothetical protein n=1 Tax=Candidatus Amarobacter glycogenicus TaxID=3140699 RepID=UPI002A0C5824|nr:hypothetical protein [Dehalococcoidia bacterium]
MLSRERGGVELALLFRKLLLLKKQLRVVRVVVEVELKEHELLLEVELLLGK